MTLEEQKSTFSSIQRYFKSAKGKDALKYFKNVFGQDRPSSVPNDPITSAHNDGLRTAYLHIERIVNMDLSKMEVAHNE